MTHAPTLSTRPVWAAFWWSLVFGLISLYWAAGGMLGISTLAQSIQDAAREGDTAMHVSTAVTGLLKIGAGILALLTLRIAGSRRIRLALLIVLWGIGGLFTLYGLAGFVEKLLMRAGIIEVSSALGEDVLVWYLALWEPFWMLGGVLFLLTAWRYGSQPATY